MLTRGKGRLIMKPNLQELIKMALKVKTPLALAGLVIVIFYAIYREILSLNIFGNIGDNSTFLIVEDMIDKVFWLAMVALVLGTIGFLFTFAIEHKNKPVSSNVSLIDASLDTQDSPYYQYTENGVKKIRYKDQIEVQKQPNDTAGELFHEPTPREIMEHLDNLPPFQREDAANHFKGVNVSWTVSISQSEKKPNGNVWLLTLYEKRISPAIVCEVELAKYPELKIINKDQEFKIEGEIDIVSPKGSISLINCRLYF